MVRLASLTPLILLGGCKLEPVTTSDIDVSIPAHVWSGGTMRITSPSFAGGVAPAVILGRDTLPVSRLDSVTLTATVPDTSGQFTVKITIEGRTVALGDVAVHGFRGLREGLPPLVGARPWPRAGHTVLAFVDSHLVRVDLATGRSGGPLLPDSLADASCLGGLGPSYLAGAVVVAGPATSCERLRTWAFGATYTALDSGPRAYGWPAAHVGPGRWIVSLKHFVWFYTQTASGAYTITETTNVEQPWDFLVSPGGDHVLPLGAYSLAGTPVFDTQTGSVMYRVAGTEARQADGGDFTVGGDTLFLGVTEDNRPTYSLLVREASSGRALATLPLEGFPGDVVNDPQGPWVYVTAPGFTESVIQVLDRNTLAFVATLRPPANTVPADSLAHLRGYTIVLDLFARRLLLLKEFFLGGRALRTQLFEFDLMPREGAP